MAQRKCPACAFSFSRAKIADEVRYCPDCGVALHYQKKKTILLEDKETAAKMVAIVTKRISERTGTDFLFEGGEYYKQLGTAYRIIERSKAYIARQEVPFREKYHQEIFISPHEFAIKIVEHFATIDPYYRNHLDSLIQLMRDLSSKARDLFIALRRDYTQTNTTDSFDKEPDIYEGGAVWANSDVTVLVPIHT